jgi:hypothetical protein
LAQKFGLKGQLENLMRNFIRDHWPAGTMNVVKLSAADVSGAKSREAQEKKPSSSGRNKLKKSGGTGFLNYLKVRSLWFS